MSDFMKRSGLDGQQQWGDSVFPAVFEFSNDGSFTEHQTEIAVAAGKLIQLSHQHGAVLLRNTRAVSAEDFDSLVCQFQLPNFPYEQSLSNAVRVNKTERVFTANEAPSDARIFLHHEMAQTPIYPRKLFFFCEQPAVSGGATPLCRSDVLVEKLNSEVPQFVRDCQQKGLRYSHMMPDDDNPQSGMGRSWRSTFRATSKEECERNMSELGYIGVWQSDGSLKVQTPVLPAVMELSDGRRVFFNQLIAAYSGFASRGQSADDAITFGDGSLLPEQEVQQAIALAEELTFELCWELGDVVLVDNLVSMHGRRPFDGPRKILASLVA